MVVVAIPGGTGGVGRTVANRLKEEGKHDVLVLTRKPLPADSPTPAYPVIVVDYSDIESLIELIKKHQIHTIISAIAVMGPKESEAQINLIKAAAKSGVTQRFAPSEWGFVCEEDQVALFPPIQGRLDALHELKQTSLSYTLYHPGYFMDYFCMPHIPSNIQPFVTNVDFKHNAAVIPGDGNTPVTFTHTTDVAKFVAASLDLEEWPEHSFMIGDQLTWNEAVEIVEAIRGVKFDVTHDPPSKLLSREITELPSQTAMFQFVPREHVIPLLAVLGLFQHQGKMHFKMEGSLNEKLPGIKTMKLKESIEKAWGGR